MSLTPGGGPPARRSLGFEQAYQERPPWDIGRPQPEVVRLADDGEMVGSVLDVGCGTGENALELARRGLDVLGVDAAPTAIRRARDKAEARGSQARFEVADALELSSLGREFDSVLDCGLFHVFDDDDRRRYVASLRDAIRAGAGSLCWCSATSSPPTGAARDGSPRRSSATRSGRGGRWSSSGLLGSRRPTLRSPGTRGVAGSAATRREACPSDETSKSGKAFHTRRPSDRCGRDGVAWPILGDCGSLDPGSNGVGDVPLLRRVSVPALPGP